MNKSVYVVTMINTADKIIDGDSIAISVFKEKEDAVKSIIADLIEVGYFGNFADDEIDTEFKKLTDVVNAGECYRHKNTWYQIDCKEIN